MSRRLSHAGTWVVRSQAASLPPSQAKGLRLEFTLTAPKQVRGHPEKKEGEGSGKEKEMLQKRPTALPRIHNRILKRRAGLNRARWEGMGGAPRRKPSRTSTHNTHGNHPPKQTIHATHATNCKGCPAVPQYVLCTAYAMVPQKQPNPTATHSCRFAGIAGSLPHLAYQRSTRAADKTKC